MFLLIGKTSALTMNIAGVIKDWMLIFFSFSLFRAPVTALNLGGYAFCCTGARPAPPLEECCSVHGGTGASPHCGSTIAGSPGHAHRVCCMALCKALEAHFSAWAPHLGHVRHVSSKREITVINNSPHLLCLHLSAHPLSTLRNRGRASQGLLSHPQLSHRGCDIQLPQVAVDPGQSEAFDVQGCGEGRRWVASRPDRKCSQLAPR